MPTLFASLWAAAEGSPLCDGESPLLLPVQPPSSGGLGQTSLHHLPAATYLFWR